MILEDLLIDKNSSIKDALQRLDKTAHRILFVAEEGKLRGSLTDGDIRRFLLKGGSVESPALDAAYMNPRYATSGKQAEKMLSETSFLAVPIVDDKMRIISLVFPHGRINADASELSIPVVIMAGGQGKRLEPFTRILPKPLIPVGDKPIIEHIMAEFQRYGCQQFHIIVNYKKQLIKAYFSESDSGVKPFYYDEDTPLGTGGGLYLLKGTMKETFFLTNCDVLIKADYESILRQHKESESAITMICGRKEVTIPYGVVEVTETGDIREMREKPNFNFLTNTGFYIVEPEVLDDIEDNTPISFPDIIEGQRQKGRRTMVYSIDDSEWMDMGQLNELEKMRVRLYGK